MIWFFLAGMIAGAVGWNMFVCWLGKKLEEKRTDEDRRGEDGGEGNQPET